MSATVNLAAIDAGSNAIRLVIARAESASKLRVLKSERVALRLGHDVFTRHKFDKQTTEQAVQAFRHFRSLMSLYGVKKFRAVATSAAREARNQRNFTERIYQATGIRLEVIDEAEEARLVRSAVHAATTPKFSPQWIADLGGGSLEISILKSGVLEESVGLPIGAVRIMEMFDIQGPMGADQVGILRAHVMSLLRRYVPPPRHSPKGLAVACGGNAEALALVAPGEARYGIRTLDLKILRRKLPQITALSIQERMKTYRVRKDRADVMGIAGVVLASLGRWWKIDNLLVPRVGVKEGVLIDLLRSVSVTIRDEENTVQRQTVLQAARRYAARFDSDGRHAEKVRQIAVSLFDQLRPVHNLAPEMRLILELASVLHDIGHVIRHKLHHKHGEYLVRHGNIAGLDGRRRNMVACVIRYHSEPEPAADHKLFTSFPRKQQAQIRSLVALLRIADALDCDHRQNLADIQTRLRGRTVFVGLRLKRGADLILWSARRRAELFESAFDRNVEFREISG